MSTIQYSDSNVKGSITTKSTPTVNRGTAGGKTDIKLNLKHNPMFCLAANYTSPEGKKTKGYAMVWKGKVGIDYVVKLANKYSTPCKKDGTLDPKWKNKDGKLNLSTQKQWRLANYTKGQKNIVKKHESTGKGSHVNNHRKDMTAAAKKFKKQVKGDGMLYPNKQQCFAKQNKYFKSFVNDVNRSTDIEAKHTRFKPGTKEMSIDGCSAKEPEGTKITWR